MGNDYEDGCPGRNRRFRAAATRAVGEMKTGGYSVAARLAGRGDPLPKIVLTGETDEERIKEYREILRARFGLEMRR